jgi:hypothetical protein
MSSRLLQRLLLCMAITATASAHAAGGPDAYGYTWLTTADPGGPVFNWIDISATGTLVTGLADDNAAAALPLPQPFRYYWTDVAQFVVGSNGWIGMQPAANIASCFPAIPTAGGAADGYIAAFMSDLIFGGAGNPASVRTFYDTVGDRFIISYLDVPYWQAAAPGFFGSNTFQIILDYTDDSITVQFLSMTPFINNGSCAHDAGMGIESPQGTIGLGVLDEVTPLNGTVWRFVYPDVPLISVIDPSPSALLNADSAAMFVHAGAPQTLNAIIGNSGNAMTTSGVTARAEVLQTNTAGASLYDQSTNIGTLGMNQQVPVNFSPDYVPLSGPQVLRVSVSGGGDINPGNNSVVSEIRGLIPGGANQILGYVDTSVPTGALSWNGASGQFDFGAAILIVPPTAQYVVNSLHAFISTIDSADGMALELRDNDGPNGAPGTSLALFEYAGASVGSGTWLNQFLPTPIAVDADGFYLVWYQRGLPTLGIVSNEPVSRRNYELLGGAFSPWRSNATSDLMLRVGASSMDVQLVELFRNGFE